ncbi:sugar ABC transporter permease [Phototrophicus methaneseepsis]|uniref:Sugar ABC transporter permease n=1 Tax=Phototrophicus methaneseepsis TaxID=2710758 RepID=A0A7S8IE58_9CHLR|nr:sugar ABC transporter permease [Phototrophicus methaneseepsis]QPC83325.1 sugar ABC transporter permease [Phototrophicus methaneseepsis]
MTSPYTLHPNVASSEGQETRYAKFRSKFTTQVVAYLFLLPAILAFALFAWLPILKSIQMSFQNVTLGGQATWVGLDNFQLMLKDPALQVVWKNSLEFTVWSLLLGYLVPVVLAILVREMRFFQGFFRVVYFLPTVVPAAIAVIIWRFIYDPDGGVLNELLAQFGIARQLWLQDASLAKPALVAVMTWSGFGTTALIYLASLQDVSQDLYEAAELDGASPLQRIIHISLPHLYPIMSLMLVLQIITVVQVFTEPFLLTNGGPGRETLTPAMHIYNRAFIRLDMGYASAWSVVMILVLLVFSAFYQYANSRLSDR